MKRLIALFIFVSAPAFIGCANAQVAPTSYEVAVSWTAPPAAGSWTGCTAASPCSYVVSRITLAAGTSTCPAANIATPNYAPLNTASQATGQTYSDTSASGLTVCYIAQTEQGTAVSQPSNTVGPFAVPASPLAPALSANQTLADNSDAPGIVVGGGMKVSNSLGVTTLTAKLEPIR